MIRALFALLVAITSAFGVVSTPTNIIQYTGTGSTALYAVPFKFFQPADLALQETTSAGVVTKLVLTTDYTVIGAGLPPGGSITLTAGNLASGTVLTIQRDPSQVQNVALSNGSPYYGSTIESALDLLTMEVQATRQHVNNAIQVPLSESLLGLNLTLPTAALRANKYLGFDSGGNVTLLAGGGGGGGGGGTVTSVALSVPAELSVAGSPIATSGTFGLTWASASGRKFISSPSDGTSGAYAGRAIVAADLPATAVTPGTYTNTNLTVDAQGRITAAANGAGGVGGGTVTSVSLTMPGGIFGTTGSPVTTSGTLAVSLLGEVRRTALMGPALGVASPPTFRQPTHIDVASAYKLPVKAVLTANRSVSSPGSAAWDGVSMTLGDRVLLTGQTAPSENGIWSYVASGSPMTRPLDFDVSNQVQAFDGMLVYVTSGTAKAGSLWALSNPGGGVLTIDTDSLTFNQVTVNANSGGVTGTLPVASGGSGATTLTGYLKGNGTSAFTSNPTVPLSDVALTGLVEFQSGMIELPAAKTYTLIGSVPYPITIQDVRIGTFGGTITANFKINSTSITGLSAIAVTSTRSTYAATAANTMNAGDTMTMVVSSPASANDLDFTVKWTRQ